MIWTMVISQVVTMEDCHLPHPSPGSVSILQNPSLLERVMLIVLGVENVLSTSSKGWRKLFLQSCSAYWSVTNNVGKTVCCLSKYNCTEKKKLVLKTFCDKAKLTLPHWRIWFPAHELWRQSWLVRPSERNLGHWGGASWMGWYFSHKNGLDIVRVCSFFFFSLL